MLLTLRSVNLNTPSTSRYTAHHYYHNLPGLSLPGLDTHFADVEVFVSPNVRPAEIGIFLPAQLDHKQLPNVHVSGQQE